MEQVTEAAQGKLHPSVAAALRPLAQLFWRQGDSGTALALQTHACSVLDADGAHALSGEPCLPGKGGNTQACSHAHRLGTPDQLLKPSPAARAAEPCLNLVLS